ncbi:MAG: L-threonylcarbamoyladenylate synthase [Patescibacteria group bacterium]
MRDGDVEAILNNGGIGVLPTDTLYGLVGSALLPKTVERIYKVKERSLDKPLIVLIDDIEEVEQFGVVLSEKLIAQLHDYWPGAYSIILPTIDEEFFYLNHGSGTIAFRLPDKDDLRELLRKTGPVAAPSANVEGRPPARTIEEAQKYFGADVDFYIDGGELGGKPSTILDLTEDELRIVRA